VILESAVLTALATGALGSAHCAAMCGPLAVAGCTRGAGVSGKAAAGYFGGRLVAYATVGAVLGHLGHHALCILPMDTIERIAIAAVATAAAWRGISLLRGKRSTDQILPLRRKQSGPTGIFALLGQLWPKRGLGLGLATGIMPCGLLLPAWALAAGTASALSGAVVMAVFSVATLPGLLIPLAGRRLLQRVLDRLPRAAHGLAWCALAAWIAVRPLLVASGACHF
jgi:sulfite exporter TauE/SafE